MWMVFKTVYINILGRVTETIKEHQTVAFHRPLNVKIYNPKTFLYFINLYKLIHIYNNCRLIKSAFIFTFKAYPSFCQKMPCSPPPPS